MASALATSSTCVHCEETIHRGLRGWLHISGHAFSERYECFAASDSRHLPQSILGPAEISFSDPERCHCEECGLEIQWIRGNWSDTFMRDETLVIPENWHGMYCALGDDRFWPGLSAMDKKHVPELSFITSSLQQIRDLTSGTLISP